MSKLVRLGWTTLVRATWVGTTMGTVSCCIRWIAGPDGTTGRMTWSRSDGCALILAPAGSAAATVGAATDINEGFYAILGSPNGGLAMNMLIGHKEHIGLPYVEKVVLLKKDPRRKRSSSSNSEIFPCFLKVEARGGRTRLKVIYK